MTDQVLAGDQLMNEGDAISAAIRPLQQGEVKMEKPVVQRAEPKPKRRQPRASGRRREAVPLPNLVPEVFLPPRLAKDLRLIIASGQRGITTVEMQAAGSMDPNKSVSALKKLGALIETERTEAVHPCGSVHRSVALHRYAGWNPGMGPVLQDEDIAEEASV